MEKTKKAMQMTKEQYDAVYTRDKNLLVSASAGSGKTFVLVERIIALLVEDEVAIDSLLITTFTNAAAAEMREKIAVALRKAIVDYPEKKQFLVQQIQKLHLAQISTIHAFCQTILKEHFFQIELDPNFKIGVEQVVSLLKKDALEKLFSEKYKVLDEDFIQLLEYYGTASSDQKLRDLILKIHSFALSKVDPFDSLEAAVEQYMKIDEHHFLLKALAKHKEEVLRLCIEEIKLALAVAEQEDGPFPYIKALESDLQMLTANLEHDTLKCNFINIGRINKNDKEFINHEKIEYVKDKRKKIKAKIKKLETVYDRTMSEQIAELEATAQVLQKLVVLVREFNDYFCQLKRDENILDFDDLQLLAIECLGKEAVADYYRQHFRHIFVDEYQDSNAIQEEIINRIKREDNLFFVGDVKQSIYGFRQADPELFLAKFNSYPQQVNSARIDLNANFRSHPNVLNAINEVFNQLMTVDFGGINYRQDAQLVKLEELKKLYRGQSKAALSLVEITKDDNNEHSKQDLVNALLAKRIKDLLKTKFYDKDSQEYRYYRFDDIAILLRNSSGVAREMASFLAKQGIAAEIDDEDNYFELIEVATFINFLKIIDNPFDDLAMLSVLRSHIVGLNDQELAELAEARVDGQYYMECITNLLSQSQPQPKLVAFDKLLSNLRAERYLAIGEFIWLALETSNYYNYVLGLENGLLRANHLRLLAEKANEFERNGLAGLQHFIAYLDKLKRLNVNFGANAGSTALASIKILTIHKSKGLEYNALILANVHKEFNKQDLKGDIFLHSKLGIVSKWRDPNRYLKRSTLAEYYLKQLLLEETKAEEMRLLYVALTRAKYHLELVGCYEEKINLEAELKHKAELVQLIDANSYLKWLLAVLSTDSEYWQVNTYNADDLDFNNVQQASKGKQKLADLLSRVEAQAFDFYDGLSQVSPAKISVSELKSQKAEQYQLSRTTLVDSFAEEQTSLQKGNIYHKIFEDLIFKGESIEEVWTKASQQFSDEQLKLVKQGQIAEFLQSKLYQRIARADEVWREQPFVFYKEINHKKVLVQGVVDLLFIEDNQIVIVDYKSDYVQEPNQLVERYQRQLELYAEAASKAFHKSVKECLIYSIQLGKTIAIKK